MRSLSTLRDGWSSFLTEHKRQVTVCAYAAVFVFVNIWLVLGLVHSFHKSLALFVLVLLAWTWLVYLLAERYFPAGLRESLLTGPQSPVAYASRVFNSRVRLLISAAVSVALAAYVVYLCAINTVQLISLASLVLLIIISVLVSASPARIKWRPVLWGLLLQYVAGFVVLKWSVGQTAFQWATEQLVAFLSHTSAGTTFVFGFVPAPPNICGMDAPFSFTSLPIIIFFGSLCSAFYYLGIVQWFLVKVAIFLQYTMDTTAAESLNAAASIFLGPTEAAVMMRISLKTMTDSEIMATMTAGFAMISGSLFALYIAFGACPVYLLAANIMSAPAVLAVSKVVQPEVQKSKQKRMADFKFPPCMEHSLLESISAGAVQAVGVIFAIIANLIVFLAMVDFFDKAIGWLTSLIGFQDVTFNTLLGYTFFPLAYVMGVSDATDPARRTAETLKVAQLIGTKTLLNEFIAYDQMSGMLLNNQLGGRAQMMAIFACCGYSNASQVGSQLGIFGAMAPTRKKSFARVAIRSLIAGSIACFMTAAVAGTIVSGSEGCRPSNATLNCVDLG